MLLSDATALTVQKILRELKGVNFFKISALNKNILDITSTKLHEIEAFYHSIDQQEMAAVRYWLLKDPLASWRKLIVRLDYWAGVIGFGRYSDIADRIRHYAEELTGICFS